MLICFSRRMTITDSIERALKKGGDNEKAAAANLASLLCIQLGVMDMAEHSCQELLPVLMFVVNDESVPLLAREKVINCFCPYLNYTTISIH
jgi:hypothetical protein